MPCSDSCEGRSYGCLAAPIARSSIREDTLSEEIVQSARTEDKHTPGKQLLEVGVGRSRKTFDQ